MNTSLFFNRYSLPLLVLLLAVPAGRTQPLSDEKITFAAQDGSRLVGTYHPPRDPSKTTLVLLHGLGSSKEEWQPFETTLARAGYGYFAYDMRAHGESILVRNGRPLTYRTLGAPGPGSEWDKMPGDLAAAVRYLAREKKTPESSIGLAGASVGANLCLLHAASRRVVPFIILLSPGLEYAAFRTGGATETFRDRSVAIAASRDDRYAFQSSVILYQPVRDNPRALFIEGDGGHGVQMFDGKLEERLLSWIERVRSASARGAGR